MLRLMQADFYRLTRTKSVYIILSLFISLFIIATLTETVGTIGVTNEQVNKATNATAWDFISAMKYFTVTACILIYCFIVYYINIFSIEFSNRTYKNILMAGTSRSAYLFSKLLMLFLMIISTTVIIYLIITLVCFFYYGKPADLPDNYLMSTLQFIVGLSLCIMVYYILASFLQILFNSIVAAIIFIVLAPLAVQILQVIQGWDWLKYIDYLSLTQSFGLGAIQGADLLPYIYINGVIIVVAIALSIILLKRKEF